jgi:ankyrin repeat protein
MADGIIPAAPLEYWAALGRLDEVQKTLAENPDVNARGQDGYTALHAAAENGRLAVVLFLLKRGAEVNPRLSSGETPLDLAIAAKQQEAADALRRYGALHGRPL